ncbi:MAG: phosphoribosylformylglycinamidine synthase I [bacterium]
MGNTPKSLIMRGPGTNCNQETKWALELCGSEVEECHINRLMNKPDILRDYQLLAIPGGFTYGDDISAGAVLALEIRKFLGDELSAFIDSGKLVVGICNGFQVLIKSGFLPGNNLKKKTTLFFNDSAKFECRWIYLKKNEKNNSPFLSLLPDILPCPVAHAEGKFITDESETLKKIENSNQVAFKYVDKSGKPGNYPVNPNGSLSDIAGITDPTGRVLGMMPHPERSIFPNQLPDIRRDNGTGAADGLKLFEGAISYIKKNL